MSANYYLLRRSSDPDEIGVSNGIKQADILRDGFSDYSNFDRLKYNLGSRHYWEHKNEVHTLELTVECVKLLKDARLTDILQFGPALINCPFMISHQVAEIFNKSNLCEHKLFSANVICGHDVHKYFLIHFPSDHDRFIDFERTQFFTGTRFTGTKQVVFSDFDNYTDQRNSIGFLGIDSMYLTSAFDWNLDLFRINGEVIISDRLFRELTERHITGVNFLPAFGENSNWMRIIDEEK